MAKKSKVDKLYNKSVKAHKEPTDDVELLKLARERSRDGTTYWQDVMKAAEEGLVFLGGEQWPSEIKTERELEQRPCLVNNVLPSMIKQITGDQRLNKPSIKISATQVTRVKDVETEDQTTLKISNTAGTKDYELAEVMQGLVKNIEYQSDAEDAYDVAFQTAVEGAIGYLRLLSDYMADDSFEQECQIAAIENQFSVTMDPSFKKSDTSDKNWCFVDDMMDKEVFKKEYPNATSDPVDDKTAGVVGNWYTEKKVRVSEYFVREPIIKELAFLSDGRTMYLDDIEKIVDELLNAGIQITKTRKVKTYKVMWRKITGHDVLEGPVELPGPIIPIFPVFGERLTIKDKRYYRSAFFHSIDAQRMANYWDSAGTESVALAPKAPFIGMEGHIEGYEDQWKQANTKNFSMLTYVPQHQNDRGPMRSQPAIPPSAEITLGMRSTDKIKSTMGMYDASLGAKSNETSGVAIKERRREADVGSFLFVDNLSKALRCLARSLMWWIPVYYDTERVIRIKFQDDTEDFVKINEKILDEQTNEYVTISDLGVSKYDVIVSTGPAFTTQRMEAAESMVMFAKAVPEAAAVMMDLIALNMDWPGADVIADRLKKIIPPNVLTAEERKSLQEDSGEEEGALTPEQELQAQQQELQAEEQVIRGKEADAKIASAEADIAEAEADTIKAHLETDDAKAALARIDAMDQGGNDMAQTVRELVAQALVELQGQQN